MSALVCVCVYVFGEACLPVFPLEVVVTKSVPGATVEQLVTSTPPAHDPLASYRPIHSHTHKRLPLPSDVSLMDIYIYIHTRSAVVHPCRVCTLGAGRTQYYSARERVGALKGAHVL